MARVSEYDLSCPICQEIFNDPVILTCGHSFCSNCLKSWWAEQPSKPCPYCKRRSSREDLPLNLTVKNLCLDFVESSNEPVCSVHSEKLNVYCCDDQQPICLVCRDSQIHKKHTFKPINEVTPDFRDALRKILRPLEEHLQVLSKSRHQFSAVEAYIKTQARLTESQIQEQFKKFHQFLKQEEQARIRALREEEEHKRKSINNKIEALSREIEALSKTISATEEQLRAADASFLLQYKAAAERVHRCPLVDEPELEAGALIDQAKHLGNLGFNIWNKMKDLVQVFPVVLDPNTAHPDLSLNGNLTGVQFCVRQKLPENPERFQWYYVLGSEGFTSGTHSWEVDVPEDDFWSVGVVNESVQRKGPINNGVWELSLSDGRYHYIARPKRDKILPLKKVLLRVRVKLDYDKGTLSFSDADTNTLVHTFHQHFSERLFPCFRTSNNTPLQITPLHISIKTE